MRASLFLFALLMAALALVVGCVGSFEEAKIASGYKPASPPSASSATPGKRERCDRIDAHQAAWGATTLVLGAAAGASGLTSWAVESPRLEEGLAIGAGVAGLAAAGTGYVWDRKSKQWIREGCEDAP